MSTGNASIKTTEKEAAAGSRRWQRVDEWLESLGEKFNPILVKETRQALKSRQFLIAFSLLLISCWIWSLMGTAQFGSYGYLHPNSKDIFLGYYVILVAALGVVVPYTTFRSLVAESDDNTYDLLSITTLTPRQIIGGKLGSAAVQMSVYFAAVAPCLAFTYLLRGIDIFTIGLILAYTILGSLGLSMTCLLIASAARAKFVQVILSVGVIIGALWISLAGIVVTEEILRYSRGIVNDPDFLMGCLFFGTLYVTTFALAFLSAASRITFESENRSTALRVASLVQYVCLMGWIIFPWLIDSSRTEIAGAFLGFSGLLCYVTGIFMTSESPEMSRRVARQIPSRPLYRSLFFWFMPGPATGYMFALANMMGAIFVVMAGYVVESLWPTTVMSRYSGARTASPIDLPTILAVSVICWSYLAIFLGLGMMIIRFTRRYSVVSIFVAIAIHLILVAAACAIPFVIEVNVLQQYSRGYTLLHISNPFYTVVEAVDDWSRTDHHAGMAFILIFAAAVVLALNLKNILFEIRRIHTAVPARVMEDEAEVERALEPGYQSPWD